MKSLLKFWCELLCNNRTLNYFHYIASYLVFIWFYGRKQFTKYTFPLNNITLSAIIKINSTDQINHMAVQNAFLTCFVIWVNAVQILCWCQKFRGSFSQHTDKQSIAYKAPDAPSHSNTRLRIPHSLNRQLNQCNCAVFLVRKQQNITCIGENAGFVSLDLDIFLKENVWKYTLTYCIQLDGDNKKANKQIWQLYLISKVKMFQLFLLFFKELKWLLQIQ